MCCGLQKLVTFLASDVSAQFTANERTLATVHILEFWNGFNRLRSRGPLVERGVCWEQGQTIRADEHELPAGPVACSSPSKCVKIALSSACSS
jgi:hypothetical protein